MSNEIIPAGLTPENLPVSAYATDEAFGAVAKSGSWLPRFQLFGGGTSACKKGLIGMAHFGLDAGNDQIEDCGKEVEVVPYGWRPRALDLSGDEIISKFNPTDPEFKRIQDTANNVKDSGCLYGPEYLVWVPSKGKFALYHMNNATARREAPKLDALRKKGSAAIIKSKFIETKQYSWHGPEITPCTTPISVLPDPDKLVAEMQKFANPPESEVEKAEPTTNGRER